MQSNKCGTGIRYDTILGEVLKVKKMQYERYVEYITFIFNVHF